MSIQPVQNRPSIMKKAAVTAATAAAAAGAALYLAKTGKLDKFVGKNAKADSAINGMKKVANDIADKTKPLTDKAKPVVDKIRPQAQKAVNFAKGLSEKAKNHIQALRGKYNPDLASAADKAAETFNEFIK